MTRIFSVVKIAALVIAVSFVAVLASRLLSWNPLNWIKIPSLFSVRTEQKTLQTLLNLAEVAEKDELLTAEYFGEVIVSSAELKGALRQEFTGSYQTFKQCLKDGGEPTEAARDTLPYWFISMISSDTDFATALKQVQKAETEPGGVGAFLETELDKLAFYQAPDWGKKIAGALKLFGQKLTEELKAKIKGAADNYYSANPVVYLARGNVKIRYDLDVVLEDSECRDAEGKPVSNCDLKTVSKLVIPLNRARRLSTTINPYFLYNEKTPDDSYTHGWEVFRGADVVPQNFEMLRGLRIMAHEELQHVALATGILAHADASFGRTLKEMIGLFFNQSVEVSIKEPPAIVMCTR